jgi:hypothetical protein
MRKFSIEISVKTIVFFLGVFILISSVYFFINRKELVSVKELSYLKEPSYKDYLRIQRYLRKGDRPFLKYLNDTESGAKQLRLVGKSENEIPQFGRICVNCSEEDLQNCIILYASYNKNFPAALKRLLDKIAASDYKGHVLYRIGGWPNIEGGDLPLVTVPYAFKVCFFREAARLGYKRVLWLDTSVTPLVSYDEQFSWIQKQGYLAVGNTHNVGPYFNQMAASALGVTLEQSYAIPSTSAGILGIDLSNEQGKKALDLWYKAAKSPHAFFSARSDQNALSIILHQLGMTDWINYHTEIAEGQERIVPSSLYMLDRSFSHVDCNVKNPH